MNDDGKAYVLNSTNNPLILGANNQGRLIINNNGNVGIGTTNPETLLTLGNHSYTDGTRDLLRFASYRHGEAFTIRNNDDVSTGRLEFFWGNSTNGSGGHDNTIDNSILTLRNNGNVGIGTTGPLCGLQVGAEGEDSLKSSMKFSRFMGAGYRNYFPEGAYNGFSCDNHGTFVMGNNCHIKYNGEITITNDHPTMAGVGICMPGNAQTNQGSILFYTKNPGSVTRGDVAYDIDNGDTSGSGPTLKIDGVGRMTHNCNDQYLFAWNRPNHSMWWAHIENSYFTFHKNGTVIVEDFMLLEIVVLLFSTGLLIIIIQNIIQIILLGMEVLYWLVLVPWGTTVVKIIG